MLEPHLETVNLEVRKRLEKPNQRINAVVVERNMAAILPYLGDAVFEQKDITAMSMALDDVCKELNILDGSPARELIAERIVALAVTGERSPTLLRDRVLREAGLAELDRDETSASLVGPVTAEGDSRVLVLEARIARQRELIARTEARRGNTSEAKSLLSGMRYSLRLLKQREHRAKRNGHATRAGWEWR